MNVLMGIATAFPAKRQFHKSLSRLASLLILLIGAGWCLPAAAVISICDLQSQSATPVTTSPGISVGVTYTIVDQGNCASGGGMPYTISISGDTTGGATLDPPTTATGTQAPGPQGFSVTPGASTGSFSVTITCNANCSTTGSLTWLVNVVTPSTYTLTPTTATSFTVLQGATVPLGVQYLVDGSASPEDTFWAVDDSNGFVGAPMVTPDGSGNANTFFQSYVGGVYTVTVTGGCPTSPAPNCPPTPVIFTITVEDPAMTAVTPAGGTATIPQNSSTLLKIKYAGATLPVSDGTQINWSVTSEPALGAGTFTPADGGPPSFVTTTTTGGFTQVNFAVTTAGTYTVVAAYCPDACEDSFTFTITVPATEADLAIAKTGSPDPVVAGGELTYSIDIDNLAGPDTALQVTFTDTLPAEVTFSSLTIQAHWTCSTPAVGSGGTITCTRPKLDPGRDNTITLVVDVLPATPDGTTISNTATVQSNTTDPNPGNNSATTTTTVNASSTGLSVNKVLTGTVDNDNSSSISEGDQLNYTVTATNSGNTTLTNVHVSDDHFPGTTDCASVAAGLTCVLSGSYIVTAADVTAGSVTNVGSATSTEVPGPITSTIVTNVIDVTPVTLAVGSGDGQTTLVNTPFPQPLTVIAGGTPTPPPSAARTAGPRGGVSIMAAASGITINWSVVSGSASLSSPSSVTNASGIASMTVTAGPTPGPIVIEAERADDPSVTATFHLTSTLPEQNLADLPGLTPTQRAVAEAIDAFCSDLSSGGSFTTSSTSDTSDLAERCQEMIDSIASDPDGVIEALDQLFADIALVQSEAGLLAAQAQFDNIKARIAALRSGTRGTSFGGLALNSRSGSLPIGLMFNSLLQDETPATKEVGTDFSRWGFFAAGTIGRGDADQGDVSPGYDFDINGITVGADYRYSDKLIFGGSFGYTRQSNDLRGSEGDLDTRGWSVSAYGTFYRSNSWYSDAVLTYGRNTYDAERRVHYTFTLPGGGTTTVDQIGQSDSSGDVLSLAASFGRDFNKGGWGFGPYFRAMYTRLTFDPLVEEFISGQPGSGLALAMETRDVTSVTSTLGAKLTYAHSASWGVLMPHFQLEWQHEFRTDPSAVEAHFLFDPSQTPFSVHGDPVDSDFFRFGLGMSFVMTHGRSGFFYYERLISRERFSQNSLAFGLRLEF